MSYLLLGILGLLLVSAHVEEWDYGKHGSDWNFSNCNNTSIQQSPISIDPIKGRDFTPPFYFFPVTQSWTEVTYTDLKWTFRLSVPEEYIYTVIPFGNYHGVKFKVAYIEFHAPSEHQISGKQYPLEMQIYTNRSEGLDAGICPEATFSFLFENKGKDNKFLSQFLGKITENGIKINITLTDLLPIDSATKHQFFSYRGTRTVPSCEYSICWYVINPPLDISQAQLQEFNKRWKDNKDFKGDGNYREVHPLLPISTVFRYLNI